MSTHTMMAFPTTHHLHPWIPGTKWSQEPLQTPEHLFNPTTEPNHQRVHFTRLSPTDELSELDDETDDGQVGDGDVDGDGVSLPLPTRRSSAQLSQVSTDNVFLRHPPLQTGEEISKNTFQDPIISNENEPTQRREQTRTMSSPEPTYDLPTAYPVPVGITPPRSTTSPAVLNSRQVYEDVFAAFPPSPIQSHAQPNRLKMIPNLITNNLSAHTPNRIVNTLDTSNLNSTNPVSTTHNSLFTTQWSQIQKRRNDIMGLRSQIRDMRTRLREKQNAKGIAEDRFFQRVRKKEMRVQEELPEMEDEAILRLMDKYQQQRDEYGPLEDDCNQLEDQLYADEFTLHQAENAFYKRWTIVQDNSPKPPNSPRVNIPSSHAIENFDEDVNMSYHPIVEKYLSKQGDLDLLCERLDEILDEQQNLEEQRETRAKLGLTLAAEEQEWLDNSEPLLDEVDAKVAAMEIEVHNLKQECLAQNLVDEDGEPINMRTREKLTFENERELKTGSEISQYSQNPTLLPQPLVKEDEGSDYIPDLGEKSYTIGARINKWMLDRLRSSALEVNLLSRTYENEGRKKGAKDVWQISVLRLWYSDGTIGFEAHTSTIRSGVSAHSDTPMHPSEIVATTAPNAQVQIRIHSSLPEHWGKSEEEEKSGGSVRPSNVMSAFSSRSQ